MGRPKLLLLAVMLSLGAAACSDVSDQGVVNDEDPLTSENGLASNGLASNGLASNGLASNGLASNGLASNGLVMKALRDTGSAGVLSRMVFRYIISCALGPNHSVSYQWTDSTGMLHTEINPGGLGIAPNWENGAASQQDKELVSACLAARTNSKGVTVPLSLRAKDVSGLSVSSSERSTYTYGEGAFWGNVFTDTPYLYSCSRVAFNAGAATSQWLSQGRTCSTAGCGIIKAVGPCLTSDSARTGQACFDHGGGGDWVSACTSTENKSNSMSSNVLTIWLQP
jgi:GLTT repeat (6 copies)